MAVEMDFSVQVLSGAPPVDLVSALTLGTRSRPARNASLGPLSQHYGMTSDSLVQWHTMALPSTYVRVRTSIVQ